MITLTLFLVLYVVPAIVTYQWFRRNYSPGGDWQYLKPNKMNVCIVFFPIGNIVTAAIGLVDYLQETEARGFFRLDKEDIDEEEIDEEEELKRETEAYEKWEKVQGRANKKKLQKN